MYHMTYFSSKFLFLPLTTYQDLLTILILFLSYLNKLPMLIQVLMKNDQDQVHVFQYIYS